MNKIELDKRNENVENTVIERNEKDKPRAKFSYDDFDVNRDKKNLMKNQELKRKSSFDVNDWIKFPIA